MKRLIFVLLLLAVASSVCAVGDQAYLAILAETKVMRMAGMPAMPDMPDLPPGVELPAGMAMMPGKPERVLTVRLWSPSIAPDDAFASIAPPEGLKQGSKLDIELYRPKAEGTAKGGKDEFDPESIPEFTIKIYWGSSETVKPGQPKIIKWGGLTVEQKEAMKKQAEEARSAESYFYKPNWTTGYWPTAKQPGKIDKKASLVGNYALTTNYTGNVSIEAPKEVDFLAPIEMSSPDLAEQIAFDKAIPFVWAKIPNALGSYASIMGMEGKNTLILWSSSEVFQEGLMGDMGFLQMAEVREFVKQTVFMAGDRTKVNVPAGIFEKADMAMFSMVGYGPGAALDKAQPLPRIQTKTSLKITLGGKGMGDFGE
ncbi:MAG: hypothetical protein Q7T82_06715 [Armatimonadota bacterium]|nr:hypothetical protein [Armatimonadota bacterium]